MLRHLKPLALLLLLSLTACATVGGGPGERSGARRKR